MNHERWKNRLEMATNVAVLLVAIVVLATFARSYFGAHPKPQIEAGFQKGQTFAQVPGVSYNNAPQTLLIAMSTGCRYCNESVPFYKQLVEAERTNGKVTHIIVIFPNTEDEVKQYVQQNKLEMETVAGVDFGALHIAGTPTAILIDRRGEVRDFWVGKLPQDIEQQVIKAL